MFLRWFRPPTGSTSPDKVHVSVSPSLYAHSCGFRVGIMISIIEFYAAFSHPSSPSRGKWLLTATVCSPKYSKNSVGQGRPRSLSEDLTWWSPLVFWCCGPYLVSLSNVSVSLSVSGDIIPRQQRFYDINKSGLRQYWELISWQGLIKVSVSIYPYLSLSGQAKNNLAWHSSCREGYLRVVCPR